MKFTYRKTEAKDDGVYIYEKYDKVRIPLEMKIGAGLGLSAALVVLAIADICFKLF